MLSYQGRYLSALAAWLCAATSATALTIVSDFVPEGSSLPNVGVALAPATNTSGPGNLTAIFEAAADAWEAWIPDDFLLTLHYGWFPTEPISASAYQQGIATGGSPVRQVEGSIAFNSDSSFRFFLDGTPGVEEEFQSLITSQADFGAGTVNTRRQFNPLHSDTMGSIDLYSTVLHEIGHALGLVGWPFFNTEAADGDIDVAIAPLDGTTIPLSATHLDVIGPVMASLGRPLGSRREITQLDLLAVCQVSQFEQCLVGPGADFDLDNDTDGADFLIWQRNFGVGTTRVDGDANWNAKVDAADLATWEEQFGQTLGASTAVPVPEPTSLALVCCFAAAVCVTNELSLRNRSRAKAKKTANERE